MSTHYSSQNAIPRCKRCGASLTLNNVRCANCGFNNAAPANNGQSPHYPASPASNAPDGQGQHPRTGDMLKNYLAPPEQRNRYTQFSSQPVSQTDPIVPPAPFGRSSQSWSHPEMAQSPMRNVQKQENANVYAQPRQSGQLSPSTGPGLSPSTGFGPQTGNLSPAYTQQHPPYYEQPQQRSQIGRIVGVCALLIALLGASYLGYTFLFAQKGSSTTGGTSLHASPTNPVPQGNPLFKDDFTNNNNGWNIQSYPGEFAVSLSNGSLKLENDSNKLVWELLPGGKTYNDFQLSVDATLSKGSQDNGYGVYIRGALSQNLTITAFYRFELYGDGSFAIFKGMTDANGTTTTPRLVNYTNNSAIVRQGGINHITIIAKGSSMQFIVNNQTLSSLTDASYTSGSIALFVSNLQNAQPGAAATFTHLALYATQK